MSDGRQKLSGAEYRKRAKEKAEKQDDLLKKTKKLDTFFNKSLAISANHPANDTCTSSPSTNTSHQPIEDLSKNTGSNAEGQMEYSSRSSCRNGGDVEFPSMSIDDRHTKPLTNTESCSTSADLPSELQESTQTKQQILVSKDPAEWTINNIIKDHMAMNGIQQNMNADFSHSKRVYGDQTRYFSKSLFERQLLNGQKAPRKWLIYSESQGRAYCGPCLVFNGGTQFGKEGYDDWKNAASRVAIHENSASHKLAILNMKKRGQLLGRIDKHLTAQLDEEISYWKKVLIRVVETVKALASRGLPFRGHDEKFGSLHNGNYMMALELIAQFDPFLAEHISRYSNPGRGQTSYLSSTICEEFIGLIAEKVTETILEEIKSAKYFSIIVDSTPDITHVDQLVIVVRYVQDDGSPVERFLKFMPNTGHKAVDMANAITSTLTELGIDIRNCRGQSYDNASNMSGVYNGLQAQIKKITPQAEYIPCAAHSLNLVGEAAAESSDEGCRFFALLQEVYNFFTASTHRWEILSSECSKEAVTVKSLSATRWSARSDACRGLSESWEEIHNALLVIETDGQQKATVRCEAKGIRLKLERLETAFMTVFWNSLLRPFNVVNKTLQAVNVDIYNVVQLYDSLIALVSDTREKFDEIEEKAIKISVAEEFEDEIKRKKKRKLRADESEEGLRITGREKLRVSTFLVIVDRLLCELRKRREAYHRFHEKFSFLTNLTNLSVEEVRDKAKALKNFYVADLEQNFVEECLQLRFHLSATRENRDTALTLLKWLQEEDLNTEYPNVDIALRICVCTPITNCSGERSFSWLRRVKNYLRTTMTGDRLNALAILSIEGEVLGSLNCEDLIDTFANKKARRMKTG